MGNGSLCHGGNKPFVLWLWAYFFFLLSLWAWCVLVYPFQAPRAAARRVAVWGIVESARRVWRGARCALRGDSVVGLADRGGARGGLLAWAKTLLRWLQLVRSSFLQDVQDASSRCRARFSVAPRRASPRD